MLLDEARPILILLAVYPISLLSPEITLINAKRLIQAGSDSIKLEEAKIDVITHLIQNGIDVVGHTGITPQPSKNFSPVAVTIEFHQEAQKYAITSS